MKKFLYAIIGIYAVMGILVCVFACETYFHAQDLEFQGRRATQEVIRRSTIDTVARPDTCKKCH